ncbi:MAG: hypothetical protein JWM11_4584 [Planctomycetaceae bacterium]|nr:hypothetical protein [Planctomycetaceae bacterium]
MTKQYDKDFRYQKYDERTPVQAIEINDLGFVIPHSVLDWPTPDGSYVVRMISSISETITNSHPGDPELYQRLVPELSRLSKKLPTHVVKADVYDFLQTVTKAAVELAASWDQQDRQRVTGKPVKRPPKKPSRAVGSTRKLVDSEYRQEVREAVEST